VDTKRGTIGNHAELSEAEENLVVNLVDPAHDGSHSAFAIVDRTDRISSMTRGKGADLCHLQLLGVKVLLLDNGFRSATHPSPSVAGTITVW
jgi:hypothetical protein